MAKKLNLETLTAETIVAFLADIFERRGDCVREHVAAKRYICATDPSYFGQLSAASIHSLNLQGGPMAPAEIAAFEKNPNVRQIVRLRHLDDAGKIAGLVTPGFAHYAPMVQRVVDAHCRAAARSLLPRRQSNATP